MKNFKILSLAILSLFIFSCESDDDNGTALSNASIAGTYNVTAFSASGSETDTSNGTTSVETFTIVGSNFNNCTFNFTEAGTVTTSGTFTSTATYTEDGISDTEVDVTDLDLNDTFSISGNNIIFSDADGATVTIRNFSNTGFELFIQETDGDANSTFEAEGSYTLVRQ